MVANKEISNRLQFFTTRGNFNLSTITILCLLLTITIASTSDSDTNSIIKASCNLQCQNNGYCIQLSKSEMILNETSLKPPMKCVCPEGHNGILCDLPENCKKMSKFASQICQGIKPVTAQYCNNGIDDAINKNCFCTNGGACLDYKLPNDE